LARAAALAAVEADLAGWLVREPVAGPVRCSGAIGG
jgi:hypothetical protein